MTGTTPLDAAYTAMAAAPDDAAARSRFYGKLGDSELFLLLTEEAQDETLSPEVFDTESGRFLLVFDREDRLAAFTGRTAPYAALSGRVIAQMLAGQGIGLALNPDAAPSSMLIPAEAMGWLTDALDNAPEQFQARPTRVLPPAGLSDGFFTTLAEKLGQAGGLAECAYLAGVEYDDADTPGYLLAFSGAVETARDALAKAVAEARTFSGEDVGLLDVVFLDDGDPLIPVLIKNGMRLDLPRSEPSAPGPRPAPGSDPDKPPILRNGPS